MQWEMGELGRAGGQAGMGRKMGREGKGGLEEEAAARLGRQCRGTALPYGGGGEFARPFYFRLLLQATCNDDGASNTRRSRSKWHLPALIVNDVVATESHFCELILGRYGLWCSSYCRPGSLTCRGDRARSRLVRIRPTMYRLVLDGPCLYSIYSRPIIYDSASMIKLKL